MERRAFLVGGLAVPALGRRRDSSSPVEGGLPQRVLGRTGLRVSALGFGVTDVRAADPLRRAVQLGVTYFHLLHDAKRQNPEAAAVLRPHREKIVVGCMTTARESRQAMAAELDSFLAMSGFGHVDLWYFVTPSPAQREAFVEAFEEARRAGKARFAAVTTHGLSNHLDALTAPGGSIDSVMLVHNFTAKPNESALLDRLHAAGLAVTPMKPMAGNFTTGGPGEADAQHAAALRWLLADPRVSTVPTSMASVAQVEANVAAAARPFSPEDAAVLAAWTPRVTRRFCRGCGQCADGCPAGLSVAPLARAAMYAEGYGDEGRAREELRRAGLAGSHPCRECPSCAVRCPHGVDVRARVARALATA